jgi:RNA polymerase subunit RPABC4/transcription elongation factor Spt4
MSKNKPVCPICDNTRIVYDISTKKEEACPLCKAREITADGRGLSPGVAPR